jgi:hypothetical protein
MFFSGTAPLPVFNLLFNQNSKSSCCQMARELKTLFVAPAQVI